MVTESEIVCDPDLNLDKDNKKINKENSKDSRRSYSITANKQRRIILLMNAKSLEDCRSKSVKNTLRRMGCVSDVFVGDTCQVRACRNLSAESVRRNILQACLKIARNHLPAVTSIILQKTLDKVTKIRTRVTKCHTE